MRERELRLAVVCYGGVSLAVYTHGVTKEIQKLVRASKIFYGLDKRRRHETSYTTASDNDSERETDTEEVYFDLLEAIARKLELRVIVDVAAPGLRRAVLTPWPSAAPWHTTCRSILTVTCSCDMRT